jgi:hypothetical protein
VGALSVNRYDDSQRDAWDTFVRCSKNGTFLFERDYMDYHRDRFDDCSLLILDGMEIIALLPANRTGDDVHSHQGLTYGGLVTSESMTTPRMIDTFAVLVDWLAKSGCCVFHYKTVPTIYHAIPAEEDRYALFQANAELYRRDVLSVIPTQARVGLQARRRRGAAKAERRGVIASASDDWSGFWALLTSHLQCRFGVLPVHTLAEVDWLQRRFPKNIRLHVATLNDDIIAGTVIYESSRVAHVQYVAASPLGRELGALDHLFVRLLDDVCVEKPFFDFGISTESDGRVLNGGLIEQKEGFGARAVVHDFYRLRLQSNLRCQ